MDFENIITLEPTVFITPEINPIHPNDLHLATVDRLSISCKYFV